MSQNVTPAGLTGRQRKAVAAVADDLLDDVTIAARCGITRRQLARWRDRPEFIAAVVEYREAVTAAVRAEGIANRQNRVDALNDRWHRMHDVIDARADEHAAIPGGPTGLLVRQVKQIGTGRDAEMVEEYAVDTGLLRELRAHEEQAAKELGQWTEKAEISGDVVIREYIGVEFRKVEQSGHRQAS